MTKAASTGGTVPTASVVASGAQRESLKPLADGDAVWVLSGDHHRSTRSQALGCKQRACIDHSHFSPTNAAKAIPANMMMTSGQSIGSRSSFMQALIDIGAILFAAFFICLFAVAIAVAVFAFLFVKF